MVERRGLGEDGVRGGCLLGETIEGIETGDDPGFLVGPSPLSMTISSKLHWT